MSRIATNPSPIALSGTAGASPAGTPPQEANDEVPQPNWWQNAVRLSGFVDDPLFIAYSVARGRKESKLHAARAAGHAAQLEERKGLSRLILPAEKLSKLDKVALGVCVPLQALGTYENAKDLWNATQNHAPAAEEARLGISTLLSLGSLLTTAAKPKLSLVLYAGSAATYYCRELVNAGAWGLNKTTEALGALASAATHSFDWLHP